MTPVQCRMARAALDWSIRDLARESKVSHDRIVRFEKGQPLKERTEDAIRVTLEQAGVIFLPDDGESIGVRIRHTENPIKQQGDEI